LLGLVRAEGGWTELQVPFDTGGKAWWEAGKAEDEMTANTPNGAKVVHSILNLQQASQLLLMNKKGASGAVVSHSSQNRA
jgi:hypothetical protein